MSINELARRMWDCRMNFIKKLLYKIGLIKPKPAVMYYFNGESLIPINPKPKEYKKRPRLYKQATVVTKGEI